MVKPKSSDYVPDRGDIVWLQFDPQKGREQSGKRPALVLSPKIYNKKVGLAILAPITSQVKGYPFEVTLPSKLEVQGAILADHMKNLDWKARKAEFVCKVPVLIVQEVIHVMHTLLNDSD